ncbi:MAG: hypothetical protein LQ340_005253 [Diploschistes diacapsis]|nr:MAG: hypothetical protein LQ340_005253 [Diploschistes diacapsis]
MATEKADAEPQVRRNPHPDFKKVESSRPDYSLNAGEITFTKTVNPDWRPGQGANDGGECLKKNHVEIDPYEEGRPAVYNYKLLISAITPRFIGFVSTRSKDGNSTNLAPFSYTTVVNHDPPVFCIGYSGGFDNAKDSLRNLKETGECVINVISEHFIEAANYTSINSPYGISEWAISGLHPADCTTVKASRVKEAVFAIEGKLIDTKEFQSRATGKKTGVLAIIEGTRFWAREDAVNEERNMIDPSILRPISRFGGITYGRTTQAFELPRPDFEKIKETGVLDGLMEPKIDGQ